MLDLIRKRHPAPGWVVIPELGNGTGFQVKRHADAVAIGIWPSHGFEVHVYENKASRSDLIKELTDPSKADAVGRFGDYFWLAVEDIKIIDGLEIPAPFGILHKKNGILRTHRKAPKRKADAWTRGFMAGAIRKITESWVPADEHRQLREDSKAELRKEVEDEFKRKASDTEHELRLLKDAVTSFENASGVKITHGPEDGAYSEGRAINSWEITRIGAAVKAVVAARDITGHTNRYQEPAAMVRQHIDNVRRRAAEHRAIALTLDGGIERSEELLQTLSVSEQPDPTPSDDD